MLQTWQSLLGPVLGARVAGAKSRWNLTAFVALIGIAMAVVLVSDAVVLSVVITVLVLVALLAVTLVMFVTFQRVGADVLVALAAGGRTGVRRPPLLLGSWFEAWRTELGLSREELAAALAG